MSMPVKVFLHGWGQSTAVWTAQKEHFPDALYINLPGHGGAPERPAEAWREVLVQQLPAKPCVLIGWSLGGMLALNMLLTNDVAKHHIAGLVLIGCTPSFVARPDWPHGCDHTMFETFRQSVEAPDNERSRAMSRFFALMLHGDNLPRPAFNQLARQTIDRQHPPSRETLTAGLSLLENLDLRHHLDEITVPTLIMHGMADAIVPPAAGLALADVIPDTDWQAFEKTGHAPFMTQASHFNHTLEAWCQTL